MPTTIYHYYPETLEYMGSGVADHDPIDDLPLVPRFATAIEPPAAGANQKAIFDETAQTWSLIDDFRGTEYWDANGEKFVIETLGETVPAGASLTEPPPPIETLRTNKNAALTAAAGVKIISGMTSSALASPHIYPTDRDSQTNLQALVIAGNDSTFICADVVTMTWQRRMHTIAQLQQLLNEGVAFIKTVLDELDTRRVAVAAATNQTELDAISDIF